MREMDVEVRKIHAVLRILDALDPPARVRVLDYLRARALDDIPRDRAVVIDPPIVDSEVTCVGQS